MKVLQLPYVSQRSSTAAYSVNDCGIAAIASIIHAFGKYPTVDEIYKHSGISTTKSLFTTDLVRAANTYGVELVRMSPANNEILEYLINTKRPLVVLIDYRPVMNANLHKYGIKGGHFVTVVGYSDDEIIVHDPYWDAQEGAFRRWPRYIFERAWNVPNSQYQKVIVYSEKPVPVKFKEGDENMADLLALRESLRTMQNNLAEAINILDNTQQVSYPLYRTNTALRLREGPSTATKHLLTMPVNSVVEKMDQDGDWFYVRYIKEDRVGWAHGAYLVSL